MSKNSQDLTKELKYQVEELEPCKKKYDFSLNSKCLETERNNLATEFKIYAQIPGFRKGKAPLQLLKKKFYNEIKQELLKKISSAAMQLTESEAENSPVHYSLPDGMDRLPEIEKGKDYKFSINFEFAPDFEIPDFNKFKLKKNISEPDKAAVDEKIEDLKNENVEYKELEGKVQDEDMLKVSYEADLEAPEDSSASLKNLLKSDESWIWLSDKGGNEPLPGLKKAVSESSTGDNLSFECEFPDDHAEEFLCGKKLNYKVTVKGINRQLKIEDIDKLCKKLQIESPEQLRELIKSNLQREAEMKAENELDKQILEQLKKEIGKLELPPTILQSEKQNSLQRIIREKVKSEDDSEKLQEKKDEYMKEADEKAVENLTEFFILNKIARENGINVEENEIDSQIKSMSMHYKMKPEQLRKRLEENGAINEIRIGLLKGKALNFIKEEVDKDKESNKESENYKNTDKKKEKDDK